MLDAIEKATGKIIESLIVKELPIYAETKIDDFYINPLNIRSYDKEKVSDIKKVNVTYIDTKIYYKTNGKKVFTVPYFMIPNKTKLGINVIPESKEHKLAKFFIYNEIIKNNTLEFSIEHNTKISKIPINIFQIDPTTISVEETFKKPHRRADVHAGSKTFQPYLGAGIIIEIQFSQQSDTEEWRRTKDHGMRGYSVAWLKPNNFIIKGDTIELTNETILIKPNAQIIEQVLTKEETNIIDKIRKFGDQIRQTQIEIEHNVKRLNEGLPLYGGHCPSCYAESEGILMLKQTIKGSFYSCNRWPLCKGTKILEGAK